MMKSILSLLLALLGMVSAQAAENPNKVTNLKPLNTGNIVSSGYLSLSGQSNRVTISGGALLLDGSPIVGSSTVGTMINSGASLAGSIPRASDATGTNYAPSKITITSLTNLQAGTLTASNSVTVAGTTSFAPSVANGTTPHVLDTTVTQTSGSGTILDIKNNGEQIAKIAPSGGVFIGKNIEGTKNFSDLGFSAVSSLADDGAGYIESYLAAINSDADTEEAYYKLELSNTPSGSAKITLRCFNETVDYKWYQQTSIGSLGLNEFGFRDGNGVWLQFRPITTADTTPYIFDTGVAHTIDNLFEIKNNGTNVVLVKFDGSVVEKLVATPAAAPTIASDFFIEPTEPITFISGVAAIDTITAPSPISTSGGQITLIPTGIFTTTTSDNIARASTAVVGKALIMTYDSGTSKWYPSY